MPDRTGRYPDPESGWILSSAPPPERWDNWTEYDPASWPRKVERNYALVPTICFNCESGCGLLAYVDKFSGKIRRFEGNPVHPGSRGRVCAKGPATINQVNDPERVLYPMKRVGARGSGRWVRVSWDAALDDLAARIRTAIVEGRGEEVMYHVGRPGHDGTMDRVLQAWGIDGHNSHTNICSAGARLGYALWHHSDRPSPDHQRARFILLISSHLEAGHYFNPHAQRIIEAKSQGAKIAVLDPRLSNTASIADHWLPTWPGSEAAVLLAMANVIIDEGLHDRDFVRRWVNWEAYLRAEHPEAYERAQRKGGSAPASDGVDEFFDVLRQVYAEFTPEFAAAESGVPASQIVDVARELGRAGPAVSAHVWRSAASGNLGGWQVARCLEWLVVLTGSVATPGGTMPASRDKFVAAPFAKPPAQTSWNELSWPREYPLSHHEMSFLLPHFLKEGRGRLSVYFSRVYNPAWTNPDGFTWIEVLRDEEKIGCHAALTPTWNESATWADYVLPMGLGPERHDLMSQETSAGAWIGFRQPVLRAWRQRQGEKIDFTYEANPGEVWEEDEFWIELSWRIDPDGSLGIRKWFESPYRQGHKLTVEEYYRWIFENSVPGLPEAAAAEGLTPLQYMRRYGAFEVKKGDYKFYNKEVAMPGQAPGATVPTATPLPTSASAAGATPETGPAAFGLAETDGTTDSTTGPPDLIKDSDTGLVRHGGKLIGVEVDGRIVEGFATPSRKLEFYSETLRDWGWPEHAIPGYIRSQVHWGNLDREAGEMVLLPTFRLPTLIHTRSANAKWLVEISHRNPLWLHPSDATRLGIGNGELVRVGTAIGHFVLRAWITEGLRPGVLACSHHIGRWRLPGSPGTDRWASGTVELSEEPASTPSADAGGSAGADTAKDHPLEEPPGAAGHRWRVRQQEGVRPFRSEDPDSSRIWWSDAGVHQNLTFPVQPDPVSGMHCWHQKVRLEPAHPTDRYGDVVVDTARSHAIYKEWLARARPAPGPGGLRRPLWFTRPVRPADSAYRLE
ncbi:MAG: molybdopterin-dependent oxidoreductase [Acidobacteriota bacterium]